MRRLWAKDVELREGRRFRCLREVLPEPPRRFPCRWIFKNNSWSTLREPPVLVQISAKASPSMRAVHCGARARGRAVTRAIALHMFLDIGVAVGKTMFCTVNPSVRPLGDAVDTLGEAGGIMGVRGLSSACVMRKPSGSVGEVDKSSKT